MQSPRDKRRAREGQMKPCRKPSGTCKKTVQDAQEELQGNAHTAEDIEEEVQDFADEIALVENTNEER